MPIRFTCPHCGTTTDVAEQYMGQSGPCAHRGKMIAVSSSPGCVDQPVERQGNLRLVIALLIAAVVVGVLIAMLFPARSASREAGRRARCINNLKQISLAMLNYETTHRHFPPAYTTDPNGKPLLSWRVLILPYLEEQPLYDKFHLDEPWDSPHNLPLAKQMPRVFRCPSDGTSKPSETSYVMIVGPGTLSDGPSTTKVSDIKDGASWTIAAIEQIDSGICWTEPRDMKLTDLSLQSGHPSVVNVAFCDASVYTFDKTTSLEILRAMATIAGGESVNPFDQ